MEDIQILYDGTAVDFSKIIFIRLNYYKDIIEIYFEYASNPLSISCSEKASLSEIPLKFEEIKLLWRKYKSLKEPIKQ